MNRLFVNAIVMLLAAIPGSAQLKILTPGPGDTVHFRKMFDVTWSGSQPGDTLVLQYSTDGGRHYRTISESVTGGKYRWLGPHDYSDSCVLRLTRGRPRPTTIMGTTTQPPGHTPMALRSEGMIVATSSSPSGPRRPSLYSGGSSTPFVTFDSSLGRVGSLSFSPTGDTLMVSHLPVGEGMQPTVVFYDLRTNRKVQTIPVRIGDYYSQHRTDVALYHPLGDRIEILTSSLSIYTFSIADGKLLYERRVSGNQLATATFSHDGRQLVAGYTDKRIFFYRADTSKFVSPLNYEHPVQSLAVSPDDSLLAIGSNDSLLSILRVATRSNVMQFKPHSKGIHSTKFSPDGQYLLTTGGDGFARIWDWRTQALISVLAGHRDAVTHAEFTSDGRQVVTSSFDGTTRIWPVDYAAESDTSDVTFSMQHFRPRMPDTLRGRFVYDSATTVEPADSIRICNEADYSIYLTGYYRPSHSINQGEVWGAFAAQLPVRIARDSCYTLLLRYRLPASPMVDTGSFGIVVSEDSLEIPFRFETYKVARTDDSETLTGGLAIKATPNPAAAGVRIGFTTVEAGPAWLFMDDARGNRVRSIELGYLAAGPGAAEMDLADLPSGSYRVTLRSGGHSISTGIQVVR